MRKQNLKKILGGIMLGAFIISSLTYFSPLETYQANASSDESETGADYDLYEKYKLYKKYRKRQNYKKYKKYKKYKEKYKFENKAERKKYKDLYKKYKKYKKDKNKYPQYAKYYEQYKRYKGYKNKYKTYRKYAKYKKYKKYNKKSYNRYNKYGTAVYKAGYDRYRALTTSTSTTSGSIDLGEADLGGTSLGPEITVGLWKYSKSELKKDPFRIEANKAYNIKDKNGSVLAQIPGNTVTYVKYDSDGDLKIYRSIGNTTVDKEVNFDAADGNNDDLIFDAHRPGSSYDEYRGKMKIRYSKTSKDIWVINSLPLEQYTWGMGEITGTGDMDYNRVMAVSFRTYGYWKIKFSRKYASEGFKVNATPGNQIYYGYIWEKNHGRIKTATIDTQGHIVMHDGKIAITPYSSWTDGRTRSFKERWKSSKYPWCKSVSDPYGKHPSKSTSTLVAQGNHMVGLSANGALKLADDHKWDWDKILKYYYSGIDIVQVYR